MNTFFLREFYCMIERTYTWKNNFDQFVSKLSKLFIILMSSLWNIYIFECINVDHIIYEALGQIIILLQPINLNNLTKN